MATIQWLLMYTSDGSSIEICDRASEKGPSGHKVHLAIKL